MLNVDEHLLRALETKQWGRPLALGMVVQDAIMKKEMMSLPAFRSANESIYRKTWTGLPWQILTWGLRQLGLSGGQSGEDKLPVGRFVVIPNIEEAASSVARRAAEKSRSADRIYTKAAFRDEFGDCLGDKHLSEEDVDVLLKFLARDKQAIAYDGQTIKLRALGETQAPTITSEDSTIASLKTLMTELNAQVELLTSKVDSLNQTAKAAVARGNKASAIAALRSKKLAESNLTKRSATLGQLEEVYTSIEQAADQVELVRVMEASTGVLKNLNSEVGGVERVDNVVDQLREQMTQVDEIGNVINEVGQHGSSIDEGDVEDELEAMEKEEQRAREEKEREEQEETERLETVETRRRLDELPPRKGVDEDFQKATENAAQDQTGQITQSSVDEL